MAAENATTVLLIGELPDRDGYVASLPADEDSFPLPPLRFMQHIIAAQNK